MTLQKYDLKKIDSLINDTKIPIRIACLKPNHVPTVISLWYEIIDEKIYCATQRKAKIVPYLEKNPLIGFEIATDKPPYKGVRGEGTVKILENNGSDVLEILMEKYLGNKDSGLSRLLKQKIASEIAIQITPRKIFYYDYSKRMQDV